MTEAAFYTFLPILLYLFLLIYLGLRSFRREAGEEEYLLSGRSLSVPAFAATLVTTWYGGILGVGEFTYSYGISTWIVFGLPYYFFALLFALFFAPKIRAANNFSIPDMLYRAYGKPSGFLGSIFLLFMTTPAPYILTLAVLIQSLLGIDLLSSVLAGTVFSIIYVYKGGFRSVVATDKLQFVLMFSGFIILFYYLSSSELSLNTLPEKLDSVHKDLSGGMSWQEIAVWFLIASWTFIDPGFHQRCAAAKTPQTARRGILISIGFWFVFDMLTLICGLYAFVLLPGIEPMTAYPELAQKILPPVLQGIFFAGLLATVMSTIDSYTFLSALSFGRDLMQAFKTNYSVNQLVKAGLVFSAVISIILILLIPSVIQLWYDLGSLFIPPLLLPLLAAYFPKIRLKPKSTFIIMFSSFAVTLIFFLIKQISGSEPFGLEPFFVGMAVSILGYTSIIFRHNLYDKMK